MTNRSHGSPARCAWSDNPRRLITTKEFAGLAGVSTSSIRRYRSEDASFPTPRVVGVRSLRWSLGEALNWIDSRPGANDN